MKNTWKSAVGLQTENPENPFEEPTKPMIPEPSPNPPNPYPITDPIPEPSPEPKPFPTPPEPIPKFPPDVVF